MTPQADILCPGPYNRPEQRKEWERWLAAGNFAKLETVIETTFSTRSEEGFPSPVRIGPGF